MIGLIRVYIKILLYCRRRPKVSTPKHVSLNNGRLQANQKNARFSCYDFNGVLQSKKPQENPLR